MDKFAWMRSLRGAELTHAEYRVLVNLCTYADADTGQAYPSNSTLASDAAVDPKGLTRNLIPSLVAKGWIRLLARGGNQNGKGRANVWQLTYPDTDKGGNGYTPSAETRGAMVTPKGGNEYPPSAETRGVTTTPKGGNGYTEGGQWLPPHQVIDQTMNRSNPFSLVSNASTNFSAVTETEPNVIPVDVADTPGRSAPDAAKPDTPIGAVNRALFGLTAEEQADAEEMLPRMGKFAVIRELRARREASKVAR